MTIIRPANDKDLPVIESLRRADGQALGFLPKQRFERIIAGVPIDGRARWLYEWLLVAEDNGEVTGFCFASFGRMGAKIEQVCVRRDARRMERALALVDMIETEAHRRKLPKARCRVAVDLEANLFWRAAGWSPIAKVVSTWLNQRESKSRRPLYIYEKELCQSSFWAAAEPQR